MTNSKGPKVRLAWACRAVLRDREAKAPCTLVKGKFQPCTRELKQHSLRYNLNVMNAKVSIIQTTPATALGVRAFIASTKTTTIKG